MNLEELAKKYGTDKYMHGYCPHYESALGHLRAEPIRLLEIGVDHGWSMRMWRDFFPSATLVGVDINTSIHGLDPNDVTIDRVDCDDVDQLRSFAARYEPFDVIVDDGGHSMRQQQLAVVTLWDLLKPGGFFIMEDMHTSLASFYPKRNPFKDPTTLDMFNALASDGAFESRYVSSDFFDHIKSEIADAVVMTTAGPTKTKPAPSITSIVRKKTQ